jgi:hypothetical protein
MTAEDAMNRSDKKRTEFEELEEFEEDDQRSDADRKDFWEQDGEAPKRTPIRRKDRTRINGFQQKHKRDDKRKNNPLKHNW